MENNLNLKTISELLQYKFFIPSYQRGYRWNVQQVKDLLDDVNEFSPREIKDSNDRTWYCLQPIVVKKRDTQWDVIDGQQRLTTIFLILHYLNQGYAENRRKKLFELQYETRNDSADYLEKELGKRKEDKSNIDYFYISVAYQAVEDWFKEKGQTFDINGFESKFNHSTKIIWYETEGPDSIDIFTRINMGKIPLTNAELIKALFLNSSNFKDTDLEKLRLKQLEIASDWDKIEYALQDDAFWYFLNKKENTLVTRIEFIFELIYDLAKSKEEVEKQVGFDESSTFRYFNNRFKNTSEKEITVNWQEIKKHYQTLEEWFADRELYHKIGFLIATGTEIQEVLSAKREHSKTTFKKTLTDKIKSKVNIDLNKLEYGNGFVKNILLLHNIQTMLNNANETNRFPFDRYKKEMWDVEHISAIAEQMPTGERHQKDWLAEVSVFIKEETLKIKAENYSKENFEQIFNEVLDYFSESKKYEDINAISNLTLLDAGTNRSYKNAVFPVKRKTIIDREMEGTFIPICTKNIFMKFYNKEVAQMTFWGKNDRAAYEADIKNTLKIFFT